MSNTTKIALEASLKELLKKKPFDKITIADLTEDCGISRMALWAYFMQDRSPTFCPLQSALAW
jgi:hypothetical protein